MNESQVSVPRWCNYLSIGDDGKAIPYGGIGFVREDGQANHGFKNLKVYPELLFEVPELTDDAALRDLVVAINGPETGLFSIGCLSAALSDGDGMRFTGYLEFALDSVSAVSDSRNYFAPFFNFDRILRHARFASPVMFNWQLETAEFWHAKVNGYTCAITINTYHRSSVSEAEVDWSHSLSMLTALVGHITPYPDPLAIIVSQKQEAAK
jgi:hypothetical protein